MKNVKILCVLLLILSLISFFLTFILCTTRENEKEKRIIAEEENTILTSKNEELLASIDELELKEKDLNRQVSKMVKEKNDLNSKYTKIEDERDRTLEKLSTLQVQLDKEKKEFVDYKLKTADIVKDFKEQNEKLLSKVESLEQRLKSQDTTFTSSTSQSNMYQRGQMTQPTTITNMNVELPKVVVTPQSIQTGKVIVVNRRYNFFISNLGSADGVALNQDVGVFRGMMRIADGVVEKVYDNLSASGIKRVKDGFSIQEGDIVKVVKR